MFVSSKWTRLTRMDVMAKIDAFGCQEWDGPEHTFRRCVDRQLLEDCLVLKPDAFRSRGEQQAHAEQIWAVWADSTTGLSDDVLAALGLLAPGAHVNAGPAQRVPIVVALLFGALLPEPMQSDELATNLCALWLALLPDKNYKKLQAGRPTIISSTGTMERIALASVAMLPANRGTEAFFNGCAVLEATLGVAAVAELRLAIREMARRERRTAPASRKPRGPWYKPHAPRSAGSPVAPAAGGSSSAGYTTPAGAPGAVSSGEGRVSPQEAPAAARGGEAAAAAARPAAGTPPDDNASLVRQAALPPAAPSTSAAGPNGEDKLLSTYACKYNCGFKGLGFHAVETHEFDCKKNPKNGVVDMSEAERRVAKDAEAAAPASRKPRRPYKPRAPRSAGSPVAPAAGGSSSAGYTTPAGAPGAVSSGEGRVSLRERVSLLEEEKTRLLNEVDVQTGLVAERDALLKRERQLNARVRRHPRRPSPRARPPDPGKTPLTPRRRRRARKVAPTKGRRSAVLLVVRW